MKNPGLSVFAGPTTFIRSPNHPLNIDPLEDDPDLEDSDDNASDYVPPVGFGRWRNPGQSLHVPLHQGPSFKPGESPEDVIHGEVVSPAEQNSADKILNGEHESLSPSGNPFVERAREDLHTPESAVAVSTLTRLLRGEHPSTMSREAMDAAHQWLSRRFTGVQVNPHHGTLEAASPAGSQLVRRHTYLPAIPEQKAKPTYSLTNKHGTFESGDPERLVRAMVAFQIVHNEIMQQQRKKKDDDQDDGGLAATSGIRDWIADRLYGSGVPAASHTPHAPPSAVFEPGRGTDVGPGGKQGGYVMPAAMAPLSWHKHQGTAYSPGHHMRLMLDPHEAQQPRNDPRFPGHTFTYAPNPATGHTTQRLLGNVNYFVKDLVHPAARGAGFDLLPVPKPAPAPKPPKPPRVKPPAAGKVPKKGPVTAPHDPPLSLPSGSYPTVPPPKTSAAQSNDLCPVCASGYLEPYDHEFHECLNCGSLVKHIGLEKHADDMARRPPRGGLGRGLKQMMDYQGDPLGLADAETLADISDDVVTDDGQDDVVPPRNVHPLADEELDPSYVQYVAPRNVVGKLASEDDDPGDLDVSMGKLGYQPLHKPGALQRAYMAPLPGSPGAFARLTEGTNGGWVLTADTVPDRKEWEQNGQPYNQRSIPVDRSTANPQDLKQFRQPLADLGNRMMGEKSTLAWGHHPIEDDSLNRALRDVATHGRNSETYGRMLETAPVYQPPALPPEQGSQRQKRLLSSVGNPGLARWRA